MCLTESHAGSDLGIIRTKAEPNADGSYAISGEKIFISAGEHDMAENIIHIVLARLQVHQKGLKVFRYLSFLSSMSMQTERLVSVMQYAVVLLNTRWVSMVTQLVSLTLTKLKVT